MISYMLLGERVRHVKVLENEEGIDWQNHSIQRDECETSHSI